MNYDEAVARIPGRKMPVYWVGTPARVEELLKTIKSGKVSEIARSAGGRSISLVSFGEPDPAPKANYNSAVASGNNKAYFDKINRKKPVVFFIGPVHGHETEGLTGIMNLLNIIETGFDLSGEKRAKLKELCGRCRILVVPVGNPDGLARFLPASLHGMEIRDLRFWGQGTKKDGTFFGWPGCKEQHPMRGDNVGFLGAYYNDAGINIMHDEFFVPMGSEAQAIIKVARDWGPDITVSLHSFESHFAKLLLPSFVSKETEAAADEFTLFYYNNLREKKLPVFDLPARTKQGKEEYFGFTSALHHASGTLAFVMECPHGVTDAEKPVSLEQILEIELSLYESMLEFAVLGRS